MESAVLDDELGIILKVIPSGSNECNVFANEAIIEDSLHTFTLSLSNFSGRIIIHRNAIEEKEYVAIEDTSNRLSCVSNAADINVADQKCILDEPDEVGIEFGPNLFSHSDLSKLLESSECLEDVLGSARLFPIREEYAVTEAADGSAVVDCRDIQKPLDIISSAGDIEQTNSERFLNVEVSTESSVDDFKKEGNAALTEDTKIGELFHDVNAAAQKAKIAPLVKKTSSSVARARWGMLSKAVSGKKILINQGCRKTILGVVKSALLFKPPTVLHELCARADITLHELEEELEQQPAAASITDPKGRLPLHILGDNDDLVSSPHGKSIATSFACQLMVAFPDAMIARDANGYMPFVKLIHDWHSWIYEHHAQHKERVRTSKTLKSATRIIEVIGDSLSFHHSGQYSSHRSATQQKDESETELDTTFHDNFTNLSVRTFPRVEMWDEVKWCFEMLSIAMDEMGGKTEGGTHRYRRRHGSNDEARTALVNHIASELPNVLKTLLLLDDEGGRRRLLKSSIVRRLLLCPASVGPWLTMMLRKKGIPSSRAIDYLALVSDLSPKDYVGEFRSVTSMDIEVFLDYREQVFAAIENLHGTVASLVILGDREVERAAATDVVWQIMNKKLAKPFVVALLLTDFVLHMTLLFAFRNAASGLYNLQTFLGHVPAQVVICICVHYLIRKVCVAMSLLSLSVDVFRSYVTNVWAIFETLAVVLTIVAVLWRQTNINLYHQGLNSFVLGLLWLKVISFLKVVNKQMATFILVLIQICKDLRYFALVLMTIIFMFADMMRIAISTKDDGTFCQNLQAQGDLAGPVADFCSPQPSASLLRIYAIVVGDFNLDEYRETLGMTILFVILTILGVVIMLNVIIAVIADSYAKGKIESAVLFGRVRVAFVAQNEALASFLRPGMNPADEWKALKNVGTVLNVLGRAIRWLVLISLIVTTLFAFVYLVGRAGVGIRDGMALYRLVLIFIFLMILTPALWILFLFAVGGSIRKSLPDRMRVCFAAADRCTLNLVHWISIRCFGLGTSRKKEFSKFDYLLLGDDEWKGQIDYVEKTFEKKVNDETADLKSEMYEFEKRFFARMEEVLTKQQHERNSEGRQK